MQEDWVREIVLDRRRREALEEEDSPELRIKIRELPMADGVFGSTGCQLWSASIVMAQELLRRPDLVAGKKVVEVGAGCGLLGITIATLARCTVITDGDEECVMNATHNLKANEPSWRHKEGEAPREASTQVLKWQDAASVAWPLEERAEVVIASDIIAGMFGNIVAQAFLNILAPGGFIMLNAHEDRSSSIRGFKDHVAAAGFRVWETTHSCQWGKFRTYECWGRAPSAPSGALVSSKAPPAEPPSAPASVPAAPAPAEPPAVAAAAEAPPPPPAVVAPAGEEPAAVPPEAAERPPLPAQPPPSAAELPSGSVPAPPPPPRSLAARAGEACPAVVEPSSLSFQERLEMFKRGPQIPQELRVTARRVSRQPPPAAAWPQPATALGALDGPRPAGAGAQSQVSAEAVAAPSDRKAIWHVTGGMKHHGLMVRSSPGLDSQLSNLVGRLAHGALVREMERTALRLHYVKVRGEGPEEGWVSLFSKLGTPLLELVGS